MPLNTHKTLTKSTQYKSRQFLPRIAKFFRANWVGASVILIATLVFFWPLITHVANYSEGGDAMFNAWTLARDQHCILRQACPNYSNANIYFPNKDTMLYSETQLSTGLLSLPLYFINQNPIFSYNIMTILSFFLCGWFMYLLVKRLSKGNTLISVMAGLVFEFAPIQMSSISHLQNISIFYLPLIFLLILKFIDSKTKKLLVALLLTLSLQFYASWYQMVFVLIAVCLFLLCLLIFRLVKPRTIGMLFLTVLLAIITTLPLANAYIQFSKNNKATFGLQDQVTYSSSLADFIIPNNGTVMGKIYYHIRPHSKQNSFNPDSYSYNGIILYVVSIFVIVYAYINRKKSIDWAKKYKIIAAFSVIGITGFLVSLGPLLKLKGTATYSDLADGLKLAIPLPYILVDKLLPQLSFIRAIGRADILLLFALCALLAFLPLILDNMKYKKHKNIILILVSILIFIELLPVHRYGMVSQTSSPYSYNLNIPNVYKFIKKNKAINNIIILRSDSDYPGVTFPVVRAEDVLWAGYDNRNIFNGYSGYTPPTYFSDYNGFVNFNESELLKLKSIGVNYILVDKLLSSSDPELNSKVKALATEEVYEDSRYVLYRI